MTTQRLYRLYAQEVFGKEAKTFMAVIPREWGGTLITLDKEGNRESCNIDFQQMISWIGKKLKAGRVVLESTQTSQKTKDIVVPDDFSLFSRYKNEE